MNKTISVAVLVACFTLAQSVFAASNFQYSPMTQNPSVGLSGYALYVPAGISVNAVLSQEINSQSAVIGQSVNAILTEDFMYNGSIIATAGSTLMGNVVQNKKAGFGNRNASMQIRFTAIRTPYNNIIPISAVIMTNDQTGVLKGGTAKDSAKEYVRDTVIGAGSGAALGTAMGALSGGSVGRGAVYGTAVGAGIGVIKRAADKGENVVIPANSQLTILFDQPITVGAQ